MARCEDLGSEREITLPQGVIRYRERGEGAPIVFIHGLLVNGDLWRKVVPGLAGEHRCITPDLPLGSQEVAFPAGADLTPPGLARLIADFLAALDLEDVTLVANDTGGALTQILVTEWPERIGRVVFTSCDAFDNFLPAAFRPLQVIGRSPAVVGLLMRLVGSPTLARLPLAFGWLAKRPFDRATLASYTQAAARSAGVRRNVAAILRGISSKYTLAAAEKFHRFEGPVLLAWSREDRFFPMAHAHEMARRFPRARVEEIADSYTFSPEDQPERLTAIIAGFLRGEQARLRAVS